MERVAQALTFLAALGSGLMAGLFFIFSVTIMASLAKLTPAGGIAAMQSINVTILSGTFLGVFMGTALISLALIVAWFLKVEACAGVRATRCVSNFYVLGRI